MTTNWQECLKNGVTAAADFPARLPVDKGAVDAVARQYPLLVNAHYLGLIQSPNDGLGRQVIPTMAELRDDQYTDDPLAEEGQSPAPGLIHRYPDRVVFLVSHRCPVLCRFCMRKRLAGRAGALSERGVDAALEYIAANRSVREVILSGGDPLLLSNKKLDDLLARITAVPHVDIVRIHTRTPVALPQRITGQLTAILKKYHPLYINIHCNHPDEISPEMIAACARLSNSGVPLGSQTVLLKGVNDNTDTMRILVRALLKIRVRPYYLHHPDVIKGTAHFRVPVERGLAIMRELQGHLSGMAIPRYMIDLPGGGGKVPLIPKYVERREKGLLIVKGYDGKSYAYPEGA